MNLFRRNFTQRGKSFEPSGRTQNPDQAAIKAKQKEIFNLQTQLQEKATSFRLEVRKVLTPEQLAQLPAIVSQGAGFGHHGMGFGPPMMGPRGRW